MFSFLKNKSRSAGSVLFRGSLPLPFENFHYLRNAGFELEATRSDDDHLWVARARHPVLGEAEMFCPRRSPYPPREAVELDPRLTENEIDSICESGSSVDVMMTHDRQNVLRERKFALRFMHALMGENGISIVDHGSQRFWSRASLDEELAHDADLDIESLFVLHAVHDDEDEEGALTWLHSHGLGELGFFDFDILAPSPDVIDGVSDLTRAIAYGIVEGTIEPDSDEVWIAEPDGVVRMVPAEVYQSRTSGRFASLRDDPDGTHMARRSILCEPVKGLWSKLVGPRVEPSRWLRGPIDENSIIRFSTEATALMAERARGTYPLCRRYLEEFRDLDVKALVKIGLPIDGSDPGDSNREHLWFEVTDLGDDALTGILLNKPWHIAAIEPGQSYTYPLDVLSDWALFTPVGRVTPTELVGVRLLRQNRDAILEAMQAEFDG